MSVLSNTTMRDYLYAGRIIIDPPPEIDRRDSSPYGSCSVDLHMDAIITKSKEDLKLAFDLSQKPGKLSKTIDAIWDEFEIRESGYVLEPGRLILARTKEVVSFPENKDRKALAGRIEGRSSFARTGLLVHFTAPTIHFGFEGPITLELLNHGPMPLILKPGLAICQLIIETVRGLPTLDFPSQFQNQSSPSGSTDN